MRRSSTALVAALLVSCLSIAVAPRDVAAVTRSRAHLPDLTTPPADALTKAWQRGSLTDALYALQRARSLFERDRVAAEHGFVQPMDPRAATLVLRDLALRVAALQGADRDLAEKILSRPSDKDDDLGDGYNVAEAPPECRQDVCVHYVVTVKGSIKDDRPDLADADANGVPDYVDAASALLQDEVWATEIDDYGFRRPKSDVGSQPDNGGDGKLDVYIVDVGDVGLYGYCTTDDPDLEKVLSGNREALDMSAYCVVDNDFSPQQFPVGADGLDALRVTAAHEFFHAVQFAYDFFEDVWMLESTATWMEDEVYDDIDDNLQYLSASALRKPQRALDTGTAFGMYGNFVWWRYLAEHLDRDVVLRTWERADASEGAAFGNKYSIRAASSAIKSFDEELGPIFSDFGTANFMPAEFYEEGAAYATAVPKGVPVQEKVTLSSSKEKSGRLSTTLDHLTSAYAVFKPGSDGFVDGRLKVKVDGPRSGASPQAKLLVVDESGAIKGRRVALDQSGKGRKRVPFGVGTVERVVLVLSNASIEFEKCFPRNPTVFSCGGSPAFDDAAFTYKATLVH